MNREFEELAMKFSPTLKRIAYKLNGHFTYFNDDDLVQEALIHLWISFKRGALSEKTDSYILQGCYFHLKNYIRKMTDKVKFASIDAPSGEEEGTPLGELLYSKDESLEDKIDFALLLESARSKELRNNELKVLKLSLDGLTVREIGKRMGISHVMIVKIRKKIMEKCAELKNNLIDGYHN